MKLTAETTVFDETAVQNKFSELVVDQDGIRTEVSKKVGDDEVISKINQSAESIQIQASKVAIEADDYVTSFGSDGVKVHPKNDDDDYVTIDPTNGMNVVKGGTSVAQYGDTARIGEDANTKTRIELDGSGMSIIRKWSGTDITAMRVESASIAQANMTINGKLTARAINDDLFTINLGSITFPSLPAGQTATRTGGVVTSGGEPIGIVGFTTGNANVLVSECRLVPGPGGSGSIAQVTVKNTGTSAVTPTVTVSWLFLRNEA